MSIPNVEMPAGKCVYRGATLTRLLGHDDVADHVIIDEKDIAAIRF